MLKISLHCPEATNQNSKYITVTESVLTGILSELLMLFVSADYEITADRAQFLSMCFRRVCIQTAISCGQKQLSLFTSL